MGPSRDELAWWTEPIPWPNRTMAPIQYYGGKGHMARRIVPLLPPGQVYVEPYCGAASIFWHLPKPYPVEVLNDLDGRVVNLFRVLQDPELFDRFAWRVVWTPYSLAEFQRALALLGSDDPLEAAWALFVVANQAVSGLTNAVTAGNWSRSFRSDRGMAMTTNNWRGRLKLLRHWHDRLSRVQLDCRDALEAIAYWDGPETVFYLDPPYVPETRRPGRGYRHEADLAHHERLVQALLELRGSAVLSGYDHPVYRPLEEAGWEKVHIPTAAYAAARNRNSGLQGDGAALAKVPRVEVVWRRVLGRERQLSMF